MRLSAGGRWIRTSGSWSRRVKPSYETGLLSRKRERICWGTEGSNPSPSGGESDANLSSVAQGPPNAKLLRVVAITDDLDFLKAQPARVPTRKELARIAVDGRVRVRPGS